MNKYGEEYAYRINSEIHNGSSTISKYPEKIEFIKSQSIDYLSKDIVPYLLFHLRGSLKFFIDPGRYDLFMFFYPDSDKITEVGFLSHLNKGGILGVLNFLKSQPAGIIISVVIILIFNIIKFIGFIWFWLKRIKTAQFIFIIMLFFIIYISGISGPVGSARFVIPILPFYLFFSIYGITDLLKTLKNYWTKTSLTSPSS